MPNVWVLFWQTLVLGRNVPATLSGTISILTNICNIFKNQTPNCLTSNHTIWSHENKPHWDPCRRVTIHVLRLFMVKWLSLCQAERFWAFNLINSGKKMYSPVISAKCLNIGLTCFVSKLPPPDYAYQCSDNWSIYVLNLCVTCLRINLGLHLKPNLFEASKCWCMLYINYVCTILQPHTYGNNIFF
jgi:hypothetical protein